MTLNTEHWRPTSFLIITRRGRESCDRHSYPNFEVKLRTLPGGTASFAPPRRTALMPCTSVPFNKVFDRFDRKIDALPVVGLQDNTARYLNVRGTKQWRTTVLKRCTVCELNPALFAYQKHADFHSVGKENGYCCTAWPLICLLQLENEERRSGLPLAAFKACYREPRYEGRYTGHDVRLHGRSGA